MPLHGKPIHPSGHLPHQWTPSPCTEKKNILSPLKRCFLLLFLHYKVNIQNQLIITENYCMMILQSLFHREFPYRSPRAGITQMPVKVKQLKTDMKSILAPEWLEEVLGNQRTFTRLQKKHFIYCTETCFPVDVTGLIQGPLGLREDASGLLLRAMKINQ